MDVVKKHVDTVIVLGGILASLLWMNGKFNRIENELTMIKTVLILKGIMPNELAVNVGDK